MTNRFKLDAEHIKKGATEMGDIATKATTSIDKTKTKLDTPNESTTSTINKPKTYNLNESVIKKVELILKIKSVQNDSKMSVGALINEKLKEYLEENKNILNEFNI